MLYRQHLVYEKENNGERRVKLAFTLPTMRMRLRKPRIRYPLKRQDRMKVKHQAEEPYRREPVL